MLNVNGPLPGVDLRQDTAPWGADREGMEPFRIVSQQIPSALRWGCYFRHREWQILGHVRRLPIRIKAVEGSDSSDTAA